MFTLPWLITPPIAFAKLSKPVSASYKPLLPDPWHQTLGQPMSPFSFGVN